MRGSPAAKSAWWERSWKESFYCPENEVAVIVMVMVHIIRDVGVVVVEKKMKITIYRTTWFWEDNVCPDENGSWCQIWLTGCLVVQG